MKKLIAFMAAVALVATCSTARSQAGVQSFSVHAEGIGAPRGDVFLTGGGAFDPVTGSVQGGGGFRCSEDILVGPLAGCRAGEGVRWEAVEILASSGFKCSGDAGEPLKTAVTDDDTVVLQARFYRHGDGAGASFTAKIFISAVDEDPAQPGIQNVWIQGVGCGEARVNIR